MRMKFFLRSYLLFAVFLTLSININASLYINEILASNNSTNYDNPFYNFSDWIEIYNDGDSSVNLEGYTITDDINIPDKYLINFNLGIDSRAMELFGLTRRAGMLMQISHWIAMGSLLRFLIRMEL